MEIDTPEKFAIIMDSLVVSLDYVPNQYLTRQEKTKRITARDAAIRADERQKAAGEWEKLTEMAGVKLDAVLKPIKVWLESLPNGATKDIATNYLHYTQLGFDCWYTAKAQAKAAIMAEPEEGTK